ncbi:hypothetical protein BDV18DRAFT_90904 [Aspergillus unguis]
MPPSRAPLRAPPRQNARPQFASTPRFLFSQRVPVTQYQKTGDDDSITTEDEPAHNSTSRQARTPARDAALTSRQKEVIEDSGSDPEQDWDTHQRLNDVGIQESIFDSPLTVGMTEMDAEMEELFGPTRHRDKRRRVSVSGANTSLATPDAKREERKLQESIESFPPGPSLLSSTASPIADPPSPSLPYRSPPQSKSHRTPRPRPPATPATGSVPGKPTIRNYPRFLVSSASQAPPKPTFVLPRSPSPDQDQAEGVNIDTIPTPFSPSSHALRRRGRQRSSAQSYLPGGMAAEVRSWVLEMGSKREQQMRMQMQATRSAGYLNDKGPSRYSLILRISDVRQSALGSCGPLAFLRGHSTDMAFEESLNSDYPSEDVIRNVLLMGAPLLRPGELRTSSRVPGLRTGDVVGVVRGLVWDLDLGDDADSVSLSGHEREVRTELERHQGLGSSLGAWLVGMEWEILSSV